MFKLISNGIRPKTYKYEVEGKTITIKVGLSHKGDLDYWYQCKNEEKLEKEILLSLKDYHNLIVEHLEKSLKVYSKRKVS